MKRFAMALIATGLLTSAVSVGFAKDLSTVALEEAFIDAVGTCGPSSNVAGALGKSDDPQVKIALRNALITEAADDAAGVAGSNKAHSDCLKKIFRRADTPTPTWRRCPIASSTTGRIRSPASARAYRVTAASKAR